MQYFLIDTQTKYMHIHDQDNSDGFSYESDDSDGTDNNVNSSAKKPITTCSSPVKSKEKKFGS